MRSLEFGELGSGLGSKKVLKDARSEREAMDCGREAAAFPIQLPRIGYTLHRLLSFALRATFLNRNHL